MSTSSSGPHDAASWRERLDPTWTAEWIRRTLTDEPGPGMGSPFSQADAAQFLRARSTPAPLDPAEEAELERMCRWIEEQAGRP